MNFFMEVAKLRAARLLWAKLMKQFEPKNPKSLIAAHPLPDLGLVAHRAGRVQQRHPHLRRGDGGDSGAHAVAAHQRARRGAGAADRLLGPHRAQHAAAPAAGDGHSRVVDPWGGSLLRRALTHELADGPASIIAEVEELGGMAKAIEAGMPKLRIEEARRARRPASTRGSRRSSASTSTSSTSRKTRGARRSTTTPCARPDRRLEQLRAERDSARSRRRSTR